MLSAASGTAVQALLLTVALTVVCWGALGAAVAARTGRSALLGGALSALLPVVGWPLVWALPRRRRNQPDRRRAGLVERVLVVPAALAALLLVLALGRPWVRISAERVLDERVSGTSSPFTAVPVLAAAALLLTGAVGHAVRPGARWLVPPLFSCAACVLVAGQLLLVTGAAGPLVSRLSTAARTDAEVSGGTGARLLLAGGLLGAAWALTALVLLLLARARAAARTSRNGSSPVPAPPRRAEPPGAPLPPPLSEAWEPPPLPGQQPHTFGGRTS